MSGDLRQIGGTVAVLEPGYATYEVERAVLGRFGTEVASIAEAEPAVPALTKLNPLAVLVRERPVGLGEIDACSDLRVIVRYGVGVDNVDLEAASRRKVYVANIPDYGAEQEVSEHALALYLAVQRRLVSRDAEVRNGDWGIAQSAIIPSRDAAVLGLIGCGKIGLAAATKFRALGFDRILAFDPYLSDSVAEQAGIDRIDLETLCLNSDVVSLHAPLTPETHHILNAERIALLKPTTIIVNVSRGGLVDEAALALALKEGRVFGAGIDVFEQEPIAPENPLMSAPNTLLTDHTAWYSERSVTVLQRNAAHEIARVLEGHPPRSWVNQW